MAKIAVVTGANKGIGFSIVKLLLIGNPDWTVVLGSRDVGRGQQAVERLKNEFGVTALFRQLDVDSLDSIRTLRDSLARDFPNGIDILINNAGILADVKSPDSPENGFKFNVENVKATIRTNFFGYYNVTNELLPLLKHDGRVISVSSRLAQIVYENTTPSFQQQIANISTIDETLKLMKDFMELDPNQYEQVGWLGKPATHDVLPGYPLGPVLPYGVAKIGVNLMTKLLQRQFNEQGSSRTINAMCPGDAATDMIPNGKNSADVSADTVIYLATHPDNEMPRGIFFAERKPMDFFVMNKTQWEELLSLM